MDQQVGFLHLFQCGFERGEQVFRQVADETHGVGDDDLAPILDGLSDAVDRRGNGRQARQRVTKKLVVIQVQRERVAVDWAAPVFGASSLTLRSMVVASFESSKGFST